MSQRGSSKNKSTKPQGPAEARDRSQPSAAASRRAQRRLEAERSQRRRRMLMLGGGIAAAIAVVAALIILNRPDDDDTVLAVAAPPARDASIPQDGRTLGNPDAPVTITEYADFQCPACGQFATSVEPQLIEDYVKTGQARIVFHDFPFLDDRASGNESNDASEAAFCAQDQGEFWAYHDTLFHNQAGENDGAFSRSRLIEMARTIGIDVDQFTSCLDDDTHADEVNALYDAAGSAGVNSTPTFDINGQRVVGVNYQSIRQAIEAELGS